MMSQEQRKIVLDVYNHLLESEKRGWDGLDNYVEFLDYLDNDQLHREADVIYSQHYNARVCCAQDHPPEQCFVPILVEAAGAILELYKESGNLHDRNKYILQYYIAMNQA